MKVMLIYNPIAGNKSFKNHLDYIIEKFQERDLQIIPHRVKHIDLLEKAIKNLREDEYKKIIIAGGDGTVNQVVNILLKHDVNLPIGILPAGNSNDYAAYFNLPKNIEEMTDVILMDDYTYCDVARINDRYFVNVASLGFIVDMSAKIEKDFKNKISMFKQYLKGVEGISGLKSIPIRVTTKHMVYEEDIYFMLIMNGKSIGGFKKVAPFASINDGLLDIFIFKKCPLYDLLPLIIKVANGEHFSSPYVKYFQTDQIKIECDEEISADLDGEEGCAFPLDIKVVNKKLRINTMINNEYEQSSSKFFSFYDVKNKFGQVSNVSKGVLKEMKKPLGHINIEVTAVSDIKNIIKDLPRHNTFSYVNKESLEEGYFKEAKETLDNGYLYIVLSSTGSTAGKLIGKVTKREYAHASLSFDEELKTIISYNGGENIYSPGLNQEMIEFFNKKKDANIIVYKIKATRVQKEIILNEIRNINEQGSSYNLLGLFLPYSCKKNIMFCSQFVYTMLKVANLEYFNKKPEEVRPTDFVELDYERVLEYCSKIFLNEILE
ncbi:MAG: YegS/Rv2252/BmrU family lipid kinase [Anaeromicrobium sp.]|jgi:YegS/Rv2252/BmrU family lipid kinase|uniref:YegS/Rv2252/BmrU family lipid kinase n=1 Tax=Anaeromicrobium sp. TaxID=1929132 RepID=UPI0025D480DC|nr:YegS/Rv2252/BmrU family lipid kinase [Anaeromicrobium sp.]MCT4594752.1 YegS/Rv2252/BmrU family lipid kinase [Anaeromicrobium sp.]